MKVAVAGGHGAMGKTFVETLLARSQHQVFILTRTERDTPPLQTANLGNEDIDARTTVLQVDYKKVADLTSMLELETYEIDTVISALHTTEKSLAVSQVNLIAAAEAARCTNCFVPSTFAMPYPEDAIPSFPALRGYFSSLAALRASNLKWTNFHNGMFLDYFAPPSALRSYLGPLVMMLDLPHRAAAIPGEGDTPVVFTYSFDAARYIVRALEMPEWEEDTYIVGDKATMNEFVGLVRDVLGWTLDLSYDDEGSLRDGKITPLPGQAGLYEHFGGRDNYDRFLAIFELWIAQGQADLPAEKALGKVFPEIEPLTIKRMLEQCWKRTEKGG